MKLSLIKPLSAMLASIVMCVIFSLSHPTNGKSELVTEQCGNVDVTPIGSNFRKLN